MKTIEQKVLKFIDHNNLIDKGDKLLIAFSGGPDSVFTLHILNKYKNRFKISLGIAHVNHGLRGKSSDEDEWFCKELSDRIGVQYFVTKIDVKRHSESKKISVEEAARELRYKYLKSVANEYNFNKIITAHNINDNAETVILNLVKGTGLKGIAGIPVKRDNIIRPILAVSKQEIVDYLNNFDIKYRVDETNLFDIYERNYIRHNIIPAVKKINPSIEENLLNSSEIFRNYQSILDDYIESIFDEIVKYSDNKVVISLLSIRNYRPAVLSEILKISIGKYFNLEFDFDTYDKIKSLLEKQAGKKIQLKNNVVVYRERDHLVIIREDDKDFFSAEISAGGQIKICGKVLSITAVEKENVIFDNKGLCEFISADNIEDDNFVIRTWQPGDKFIPMGMKGYKKISDFLTEQKTPSFEKSDQLVLLNKGNIVWIPGFRIDDRYKIKKNTKKVLELCLK